MHWLTRYHLGLKTKPEPIVVLQDVPDEDPPTPAMPTSLWCGSSEKVELMRMRVESGFAVFHPSDCSRYVRKHPDAWDKRLPWE